MSMRKSSNAEKHSYDNTASLGVLVVKPEISACPYDDSEYVEVEEEPGGEPTEEWEKDIPPFLRKLSTMVNENKDAFIWKNDGSLIVKDPDYLSSYLLPTYFQAIKACSFVRQLNMYGFHKIDDPTGQNPKHYEFRHPCFVPGHRELLKKIERRKTSKRNTSKNEEEPPRAKGSVANKPPVPAPDPNAALANQSILEAVTKLQKQTQDNQQALLQVLGELKSYRQSHSDLENKLNQYIAQNPPTVYQQPPYANGPHTADTHYIAKPAPVPARPIVNVRRNPNPNGVPRAPNGAPPNIHPNGYTNPPIVQQHRSAPPPNGNANRTPVRANYPPPQYTTGIAVYAIPPPHEPVHPLDHSGQYIQQYDDTQYSNQDGYTQNGHVDTNYSPQHTNGYTPTRHSGSYAPPALVDEHSVPNTPLSHNPYQQIEYHSPTNYNSSSPYTPVHSSESTPSPPATYTGGDYHSPDNHPTKDGTTPDPSSIPPQYYNAINFNETQANEQLDEFVFLTNLNLEDQGGLSQYITSDFNDQDGNTASTDSFVTNSHAPPTHPTHSTPTAPIN